MMSLFNLPKTTAFGRVIPKNAFDEYTNTKQKKLIADTIQRITWTNKLSKETINLQPGSVKEIQIFHIELKQKNDLKKILDIFDKSIPYHIVFILNCEEELLISTSSKHDHITKANESVLDCTFKTNWFKLSENEVKLDLKESLDKVYINFCNQISGRQKEYKSYEEFVESETRIKEIEGKITKLESQIKRAKQFNKKVKLNMELSNLQKQLSREIE